jgi:hypothetical protein
LPVRVLVAQTSAFREYGGGFHQSSGKDTQEGATRKREKEGWEALRVKVGMGLEREAGFRRKDPMAAPRAGNWSEKMRSLGVVTFRGWGHQMCLYTVHSEVSQEDGWQNNGKGRPAVRFSSVRG